MDIKQTYLMKKNNHIILVKTAANYFVFQPKEVAPVLPKTKKVASIFNEDEVGKTMIST